MKTRDEHETSRAPSTAELAVPNSFKQFGINAVRAEPAVVSANLRMLRGKLLNSVVNRDRRDYHLLNGSRSERALWSYNMVDRRQCLIRMAGTMAASDLPAHGGATDAP